MQLYMTAIVYSTFLWWFSTGVIFYLNARPTRTFRWSMYSGTLMLAAAVYGVWASAASATVTGAFVAFTCGLVIWGWHTMSYYMGVITGPRREHSSKVTRGWRFFLEAAATSIYHELAIMATLGLMVALTWGQPNKYAVWTVVLLWTMQISAKLNVFLGVRNLNKEFIPKHMVYLTKYFRRRSMNLLFPFSVTIATIVTVMLAQSAMAPSTSAFATAGTTLLATLMMLAVIEHWFMIVPIRADALWRWSLDASGADKSQTASGSAARTAHAPARVAHPHGTQQPDHSSSTS